MMEVGFGGVIEKFEQHYGLRAAKVLLGLVALAIVAACVAIIWQWLVFPILKFFNSPERIRLLIQLLYLGLSVGLGVVFARLLSRRWSREGRNARAEVDAEMARSRQAIDNMRLAAEELSRTIRENETQLLVVDKNSTPEHLRKLAQELKEQAQGLEATRGLAEAPSPAKRSGRKSRARRVDPG